MEEHICVVNSGTYNDVNINTAEILNYSYKGLVKDGVFASPNGDVSSDLQVEHLNEMQIAVKAGQGVFAGRWFSLENQGTFDVPFGESNARIDSVFVQVDATNKLGQIVYRKGIASDNPTLPDKSTSNGITEYRLANIFVEANATSISYSDIEDLRGTDECPWVKSTIPNTFTKIVNVVDNGVKNNGEATDLNLALTTQKNTLYYFPKGVYSLAGYEFTGCENITIFAPNAEFKYNHKGSVTAIFAIKNCTNFRIIGGVYNGNVASDGVSPEVAYGISVNNSSNTIIEGAEIKNIGCQSSEATSGISFVGDCSFSRLTDCTIHDIQAGVYTSDYIFASGISIKSNSADNISKQVIAENPHIYNIGTAEYFDESNQKLSIDGDGIFIIQPPKYYSEEDDELNETEQSARLLHENENNIKIINPHITDCAKRALKIVARCVDIIGGIIDVTSWGAAIEYQYPRNSTICDVFVRNQAMTALTLNAGDGIVSIENCRFLGNGSGNGIVLYRQNGNDFNYNTGAENVVISNCDFEDLNIPIYAASSSSVVCESITIRDCTIGHFKGESAIKLNPERFLSIDKLVISDITFKYGNTQEKIFEENNQKYNQNLSSCKIINLGTYTRYVNPISSLIIDIDSLDDDIGEILNVLKFDTKSVYLGGAPALATLGLENPNQIKYISNRNNLQNTSLNATISENNEIKVSGTCSNSNQTVFIPIEPFVIIPNTEYLIEVNTDVVYSDDKMSVAMYTDSSNTQTVGNAISLDKSVQKVLLSNISAKTTVNYIGVTLKGDESADASSAIQDTYITFLLKYKVPKLKGITNLENKYAQLEERFNALQNLRE